MAQDPEPARPSIFDDDPEPIHLWFNLTYSSYLVLHRTMLQSMPQEWQARFVRCLGELEDALGHHAPDDDFKVELESGATDDLADYERGRRRLEPRGA